MNYQSLSPAIRDAIHGAGPTVRVRIVFLEPVEHHVERCQITDKVLIHGWTPPPSILLDGERVSTAAPYDADILRSNLASFTKAFLAHDLEEERSLIKHACRAARAQTLAEIAAMLDPSGARVDTIVAKLKNAPFEQWPPEAKSKLALVKTTVQRVFAEQNKRSPRFVAKVEELGDGVRRVAPEEADRERIVQALSGQNPNASIDRLADLVAQLVAEKTAPAAAKGKP